MLINDLKLQNNNIVKIKEELEISNRIDLLFNHDEGLNAALLLLNDIVYMQLMTSGTGQIGQGNDMGWMREMLVMLKGYGFITEHQKNSLSKKHDSFYNLLLSFKNNNSLTYDNIIDSFIDKKATLYECNTPEAYRNGLTRQFKKYFIKFMATVYLRYSFEINAGIYFMHREFNIIRQTDESSYYGQYDTFHCKNLAALAKQFLENDLGMYLDINHEKYNTVGVVIEPIQTLASTKSSEPYLSAYLCIFDNCQVFLPTIYLERIS